MSGAALVMLLLRDFLGVRDVSWISHGSILSRRRVEGDSIAFRIDDHRAKAVFPDFLFCSQDFSAVFSRSFNRFIQAAFD